MERVGLFHSMQAEGLNSYGILRERVFPEGEKSDIQVICKSRHRLRTMCAQVVFTFINIYTRDNYIYTEEEGVLLTEAMYMLIEIKKCRYNRNR